MSGMMMMPDTMSRGDLWNPSHLDLELWLDGTDPTTMELSGNVIEKWKDKSGKGRDVTRRGGTPEFKSRFFRNSGVVSLKQGDTLSAISGLFDLPKVTCYIASYVESVGSNVDGKIISAAYNYRYSANIVGVTRGSNEWRWSFGHRRYYNLAGVGLAGENMEYYVNNVRHQAPAGNDNLDVNAVCITTISTEYSKIWRNIYHISSGSNVSGDWNYPSDPYGLLRAPNPVERPTGQDISYVAPFWLQIGADFTGSVGEIIIMAGTVGEYDPVRAKIEGYLAHKFSQGSAYGPNYSFHNYANKPPYRIWSPADIDVRNQGFWYDSNNAVTQIVSSDPDHYIDATGGTMSTIDVNGVPYTLHEFTSNGIFSVNYAGPNAGVQYLVVAGGGGGGADAVIIPAGGGGAGGLLTNLGTGSLHSISKNDYSILVGSGGGINNTIGAPGGNSVFDTIIATGGGAGSGDERGPGDPTGGDGGPGGSGGGAGGDRGGILSGYGGSGIFGQGYSGGGTRVAGEKGGGGGGAGGAGSAVNPSIAGPGRILDITGVSVEYSRGGLGSPAGNNAPAASLYGQGGPGGLTTVRSGKQGVVYIRYPKIDGYAGVRQIPDKSAYDRHLTQTNPDNYPLIAGNVLNKMQVVRAAGNQWMNIENIADELRDIEYSAFYFVAKYNKVSSPTQITNPLLTISTPNANENRLCIETKPSANKNTPSASARRNDADAPIGVQDDTYDGGFNLYCVKTKWSPEGNLELYKNGVLIDSAPFASIGRNANTPSSIGRLFSSTSNIDFAEMICMNIPDVSYDLLIEGYLANKWGLNSKLPVSHKYKKTEPTFNDIGVPSQFRPANATGGMVTEFLENGRKWRAHTFTDTNPAGTSFQVTQLGQPNFMRVRIVSGGGAGGGSYLSNYPGGGAGSGGMLSHWQQPFEVKNYKVHVGVGGVAVAGNAGDAPGAQSYINGLKDMYRVNNPMVMIVEGGGAGGRADKTTYPTPAAGASGGGCPKYAYNMLGGNISIPYYTCFALGNIGGYVGNYGNPFLSQGQAMGGGGVGGPGYMYAGFDPNPNTLISGYGGWWRDTQVWNGFYYAYGFGGNGGCGDATKAAVKLYKEQAQGGIGATTPAEPGRPGKGDGGGGAGNAIGSSLLGGDGGSGMVIIAYPLEEPLT